MAILKHELWQEPNGELTLCLAGPMGDGARALLSREALLVWEVTGGNHFDVMTQYWDHMGWGTYTTDLADDHQPYPESWRELQEGTAGERG